MQYADVYYKPDSAKKKAVKAMMRRAVTILLVVLVVGAAPTARVSAAGSPRIHLQLPFGIAFDAKSKVVYVVDAWGGRLLKLSPDGRLLASWKNVGYDPVLAHDNQDEAGLAVDRSGNVYVAEEELNQIQKLSPAGKVLATWKNFFPFGAGRGPLDLAIDEQGNVYAGGSASQDDPTIQKLSPAGKEIWRTSLGSRVTGLAVDANGNLFASYETGLSPKASTIAELSPAGKRLATIQPRIFASVGALDSKGNVLAIRSFNDGTSSAVVKISPKGTVLGKWDSCVCNLWALTVDPQGYIYATYPSDLTVTGPSRIDKISPQGTILARWAALSTAAVRTTSLLTDVGTSAIQRSDLPAGLQHIQSKTFAFTDYIPSAYFCSTLFAPSGWKQVLDLLASSASEKDTNTLGLHECAFLYSSTAYARGSLQYFSVAYLRGAKPIRIGDEGKIVPPFKASPKTTGCWIVFRRKNVDVVLAYEWPTNHPVLSVAQLTQLATRINLRLK